LNEGFATYCEALWYEYIEDYARYKQEINSQAAGYLINNPGWPIYDSSWAEITPPSGVLYNFAIVYQKGSCVLHMLRHVLGDSPFFEMLHSYASDDNLKYKNAATSDLINKVNEITGEDYSWFFNEWVYGPNQPKYENNYVIIENDTSWTLNLNINQTQTNAGFFKMPVELLVEFFDGSDSLITVMNDVNNQQFSFEFYRKPNVLLFDPYDNIVLKSESTILLSVDLDKSLPTEFGLEQNYPNPFNPTTKIKYSVPLSAIGTGHTPSIQLRVYDILGREAATLVNKQQQPGNYIVEFNASDKLSSGVYIYKLQVGNFIQTKKMMLLK